MGYEALLGLFASAMGQMASTGDRNQQRDLLANALARYSQIGTPQLNNAQAQELGPSALASIQDDPQLKSAELGSLGGLQQIQDANGMTLSDRASLNDALNQASRREAGQRGQIAGDFAARGQLGSANQLAMSLQNQQDSANRANEAGLNTAANAQKRYFDSILQRGRMAGEMDDREYARKAAAARAADSIAAHNAAARTDAARYNNEIANQGFANQMSKANAMATGSNTFANYLGNEADRKAQMGAGIGQGLNHAFASQNQGGGYGSYQPAYAGQVDDGDYLNSARNQDAGFGVNFDEEV